MPDDFVDRLRFIVALDLLRSLLLE